jgi:Xaa-Pro aminopeptidase
MCLITLRQKMIEMELDAVLITNPINRRYLSGFTGSAGTLMITQERALLATDFRYYERVDREAPGFELVKLATTFSDQLPTLIDEVGCHRLGFEGMHVTYLLYEELQRAVAEKAELVATSDLVEALRLIKNQGERAKLRRAAKLTDAAYTHIAQFMQPGMTERELAWELERFMRRNGAENVAFPIIVGSGPNGAMPHATPSDRPIEVGDPVVMDFGALVDGYHADLTRTVVLGKASERYLEVYQLVFQAQQAALEGIRASITGQEADALARNVIKQAEFGPFFGHSLGHGVGLDIHEGPWLSHQPRGKNMLEPGMVVTVEPGIYLSGEFGVRIEDLVIVHQDGVELLSGAAKQPVLQRD